MFPEDAGPEGRIGGRVTLEVRRGEALRPRREAPPPRNVDMMLGEVRERRKQERALERARQDLQYREDCTVGDCTIKIAWFR